MDRKLIFAMTGWATAGLMTIAYIGRGKRLEELQITINNAATVIKVAQNVVMEEAFKNIVNNYDS